VCPLDGGPLGDLPDPLIGRTIAGRYVITERIGAGGMGTVYRARHDVVGRDVAIKFLSPDLAMDPVNRRRFLREAKAANRIDHEHIIDITDYGETDDGLVYLVMEYLDGQSLGDTLERGPLAPYRAVEIAIQIASALARAHELDVVHRDIKPDNVYLLQRTEGGDFVKLLDFGLAKMKGEMRLTASGAVFGTPEYMAPEQARGSPLTGKADLYGLGCVLYEMLTGAPPFSGSTPDLILKHIREVPQPPSVRMSDVPPELDALVLKLLEKEPAKRHGDAYHVLEELRDIGATLPRPMASATLKEMEFAAAIRAAQSRAPTQAAPPVSQTPESWDRVLGRYRDLSRRAYPGGPPSWLAEAFTELERAIGELALRRAELDRSANSARQQEEDMRNLRLRIGRAIDILGQDESRTVREIEELTARLRDAKEDLGEIEPGLRERWRAIPAIPADAAAPSIEAVESLREIGAIAGRWVDKMAAVVVLERDIARREREREDVRFQVSQLKGRLGSMSADSDQELSELRTRTRLIDGDMQAILDKIAGRAEEVTKHFLDFPDLREDVRAAQRGT
jgi:serine/threonine protein kinase